MPSPEEKRVWHVESRYPNARQWTRTPDLHTYSNAVKLIEVAQSIGLQARMVEWRFEVRRQAVA